MIKEKIYKSINIDLEKEIINLNKKTSSYTKEKCINVKLYELKFIFDFCSLQI